MLPQLLLPRILTALADGWTYNFRIPDGTLRFYPPEALGTLPAELLATAATEAQAARNEWDKARDRARRRAASCGGGG